MKPFTKIAIAVLSLISLMQLTRFILGWEVSINGVSVPVWISGLAFVVVGFLAVMLCLESRAR